MHPLDLFGDLVALAQDVAEAVGQAGQDRLRSLSAGNGDGLLVESGLDLLDQPLTHVGRLGADALHIQREQARWLVEKKFRSSKVTRNVYTGRSKPCHGRRSPS